MHVSRQVVFSRLKTQLESENMEMILCLREKGSRYVVTLEALSAGILAGNPGAQAASPSDLMSYIIQAQLGLCFA